MNKEKMIKEKDGEVCLIDHKGNVVIEPGVEVDTLYYPSNELCQVEKNRKNGYIDMDGELVIPF